ncbi:NADH-quinone oxidoreductase subunit N [Fulvivirga maritima]|uniref:NADH-quinone oxidoreductase subunit N n=1 Tax=Fulvivirga maritima TaxID=2904247 RepID=UPI001F398814|nr:NADH-quinone oxidoreductase subunit N [Fulvivirga maritima]UII26500.1 NADH-quinone oxidoreductase subunit N [Fulvivirga maritima]
MQEKLTAITGSMGNFLPEIAIVISLVLLLIAGLFKAGSFNKLYQTLALIFLAIIMVLVVGQWHDVSTLESPLPLFNNMVKLSSVAVFWKIIFVLGAFITIAMGFGNKEFKDKSSEYYLLIFGILLGAHLLVMANNLLTVYLSIELLSITAYILTSFSFNAASKEAAIKYLLFGAAASGVMLFGMSWLYALTGTLTFDDVQFLDGLIKAHALPFTLAAVMTLAGMLYKISAAPMHIWAPDVYTAAPTPVAAYFSIVPKLAGIGILMRWMMVINLFGDSPVNWTIVLAVIAMITIGIGNFSALWQNNVKRILAYSSIAHSGFLVAGLVAYSETAYKAILFYSFVYLLMNMAAFLFINHAEKEWGYTKVEDYKGLINVQPLLGVALVIVMIALTGLPPTGGFTGKFLIFSALWDSYVESGNDWSLYLLIFGLMNTVIALFYYLKLPYYIIFKNAEHKPENQLIFSLQNFLGFFLVVAILLSFFKPDSLMRIINSVSFAF